MVTVYTSLQAYGRIHAADSTTIPFHVLTNYLAGDGKSWRKTVRNMDDVLERTAKSRFIILDGVYCAGFSPLPEPARFWLNIR